MDWVSNFQLFLFDFDGLLVNTEHLHYLAYKRTASKRGFELNWGFEEYCLKAHYGKEQMFAALLEACPGIGDSWDALYEDKQTEIKALLPEGELMPGVEKLLLGLEKLGKKRSVVTNSPMEFMTIMREKIPVLNTIPNWITREHYEKPKPYPDCFLHAIDKFAEEGDKVIGFEDTPKGVEALLGTPAQAVFVTKIPYPEIDSYKKKGVQVVSTLGSAPL